MQFDEIINEINRLNFENFIWITFAIISLLNVFGNFLMKKNFLKLIMKFLTKNLT